MLKGIENINIKVYTTNCVEQYANRPFDESGF